MGTKKYTKTAWVNGSAPAVSATNLLNIENGIEGANGIDVLKNVTTGIRNVGLGDYALDGLTTANNNIGIGFSALSDVLTGGSNVAIGIFSMYRTTTGNSNTAIGSYALSELTTGIDNTFVGYSSGFNVTTGSNNIAIGSNTFNSGYASQRNVVIGNNSMQNSISGNDNTGIGHQNLYNANGAEENTIVGYQSAYGLTIGDQNCALGKFSLYTTTASTASVAVGYEALKLQSTGYLNTAIGYDALTALTTFYNCTGLGANTAVTGNNQVQLGDAATTTYAYGAVQNRSDARDKTDIKDTEIGLEFIKKLRPVDYRWNYREDYKEVITTQNEDGTREKQTIIHENDGSKKRTRFHHGLIAQEVKQVADTLGFDFGGYQDHKISGGEDVLSIGYTELIAPMIKAIQQLNAKIELLESKLGGA